MFAAALFLYASLVNDVHLLVVQHNQAEAERMVRGAQAKSGVTPEIAAAWSWLARGALEAKDYARAEALATQTFHMSEGLLRNRKLDADPWLPTAVGAAIEVRAQAVAARGERQEAVTYLRAQLKLFEATSIHERIQKNINLLSLEGKPAPPLDVTDFLSVRPPALTALRGHPVLLFFWAHWCPDCKAEAPILANLARIYTPKGLVILGPTRYYGYVAGGADASPAVEKAYIEKIRQQFYAGLSSIPIPLSAANFLNYGASTTPTLVLLDRTGVVRYYHPGSVPEGALAAQIQALLPRD